MELSSSVSSGYTGSGILQKVKSKFLSVLNKENPIQDHLHIGNINIPYNSGHMLMLGAPGTGKTAVLVEMINDLDTLGKKVVIYDPKGDYVSKFYDESKDVIVNSFDKRGVSLNILDLVKSDYDARVLASILVPETYGNEFFTELERRVLNVVIIECIESGKLTNSDFFNLLNSDELVSVIKSRIGVVDANLDTALAFLRSMFTWAKYIGDSSFSINEWFNNSNSRFMFITDNVKLDPDLRSVNYMFLSKLLYNYENMSDVYFILDDFKPKRSIPILSKVLEQGRVHKVSVVYSCFDIESITDGRVSAISYSDIANFSVVAVLRPTMPHAARSIIDAFGNFLTEDGLMSLKDLQAKVRVNNEWSSTKIMPLYIKDKVDSFIVRDDLRGLCG